MGSCVRSRIKDKAAKDAARARTTSWDQKRPQAMTRGLSAVSAFSATCLRQCHVLIALLLPHRRSEVDLRRSRRGSGASTSGRTDCRTGERRPEQSATNNAYGGSDRGTAASPIARRAAACRQQESEHEYGRTKFPAHDVVLQSVRGTESCGFLACFFL
jgi:hypothetical protein